MPSVHVIDETTLKLELTLADALTMIEYAAGNINQYASEIITIYEKMPEFDYTYYCFYAYGEATLFETMLGIDPKQYLSFSLEAPDTFFYTLFGGMAGLYEQAKALQPIS